MKKKKEATKKKNQIIAIIFLTWFFASMGAMIYIATNGQTWLFPALLGQYFLVFGIFGIHSRISKEGFGYREFPLLLFPLIGILAIAATFIWHFTSETLWNKCLENIPFAAMGLFLFIGIYLLGAWLRSTILLQKLCTQRMEAKCIKINQHRRNNNQSGQLFYCPVYQFYFNGKVYQVCNRIYTRPARTQINAVSEIYVNPKNPTQFFEPNENKNLGLGLLLLRIMIILISLGAMVIYGMQ